MNGKDAGARLKVWQHALRELAQAVRQASPVGPGEMRNVHLENAIELRWKHADNGKPRRPSASLEIAGSALMGFPILG